MKRRNNLYREIVSYKKTKMVYNIIASKIRNKSKLTLFNEFLECNLISIVNSLYNHSYNFNHYNIFIIREPKYRIIMSENIEDKIVNHLISKYILLPLLEPCLIDTNVATRIGKGSRYAIDKIIEYITKIGVNKKIYALKIDISKYFYNIDHDILLKKLQKKIKDNDVLNLLKKILYTTNDTYINQTIRDIKEDVIQKINKKNLSLKEKENLINEIKKIPLYQKGKGLPIGNMTSQILAIYYLNSVDHFIKEDLHCKYYIRYMDDFVILDTDKSGLLQKRNLIIQKINELGLMVNRKTNIYPLSSNFIFLGYKFKVLNNHLYIYYHNQTIHRINRKLNGLSKNNYEYYMRSVASYYGYFKRCNTHLYKKNYLQYNVSNLYNKYLLLKKKYSDYIILIKKDKNYYSYYNDALIIKNILKDITRNTKNDIFCFSNKYLNHVISFLNNKKIEYLIYDNNNICLK